MRWLLVALLSPLTALAAPIDLAFEVADTAGHRWLARGVDGLIQLDAGRAVVHPRDGATVGLELIGAQPTVGRPEAPTGGHSHYLVGDPSGWTQDVPHYARVRFAEVRAGVDLVYRGHAGRLEFDVELRPGARPDVIALRWSGVSDLRLAPDGALHGRTPSGPVQLRAPVAFQDVDGQRRPVESAFRLLGDDRFGFVVGDYDARHTLVIDPILDYSTVVGGGGLDQAFDLAMDADGNAYLTGLTLSADLPTTPNAFQPAPRANNMAYVIKLDPTGSHIVYATYLSGSTGADGRAIAVDALGQAAIAGVVGPNSDLFTTPNAVQSQVGRTSHAFVAQLSADGGALVYASFLSGSGGGIAHGVAIGVDGRIHVVGRQDGAGSPLRNGFQHAHAGSSDAYLAVIDPTAQDSLVYATLLGGISGDIADAVAVDAQGRVFVTGYTRSTNPANVLLPTRNAAFGPGLGADAFVAGFDPDRAGADSLLFATFLGGSSNDNDAVRLGGVALDPAGNVVVVGATDSNDFPTTPDAASPTNNGLRDGFLTVFEPTGAVIYSSYFGGPGSEQIHAVAVDAAGRIAITGSTASPAFPAVDPWQPAIGGSSDAFLWLFAPDRRTTTFATLFGGAGSDHGYGVAFGLDRAPCIAGIAGPGFPTTAGAAFEAVNGSADGFVACFAPPVACEYSPEGLPCPDDDPCTLDECDPDLGCVHTPIPDCQPACGPGLERVGEVACQACAPGSFSPDEGACVACPPGSFSAEGSSLCTPCAPGSFAPEGSATCEACTPGTFSDAGQATCEACVPGTFSGAGEATCTACDPGRFSADGAARCEPCTPGTFSDGGAAGCEPCTPGTGAGGGASECVACDPGTFSPGGAECAPCEPGTFSGAGADRCVACPPGSTSDGGEATCETCLPGHAPEANACVACTPGRFSADGSQCIPCAPGEFAEEPGSAACEVCPEGTWSNGTGTGCVRCRPGRYWTGFGCRRCPRGTIVGEDGESCVTCPPGYTPDDARTLCEPCPAGRQGINGRCRRCPRGTIAPDPATAICLPCAGGTEPSPNDTVCLPCRPGSVSDGRHCRPCQGNRAMNVQQTQCVACGPGLEALPDHTGCDVFPPGTYSRGFGRCRACPPGQTSDAGATRCRDGR